MIRSPVIQNAKCNMQTISSSKQRGNSRGVFQPVIATCVAFAFCILNFALLGCAEPQASAPRGAIVVGVRTAPNNIDPRLGNDEAASRVAQLLFNQLMELGDD